MIKMFNENFSEGNLKYYNNSTEIIDIEKSIAIGLIVLLRDIFNKESEFFDSFFSYQELKDAVYEDIEKIPSPVDRECVVNYYHLTDNNNWNDGCFVSKAKTRYYLSEGLFEICSLNEESAIRKLLFLSRNLMN